MFTLGTFLYFVFSLTLGTTTFDAQAYAKIKGEWLIEKVVFEGKEAPAAEYQGKKVVFAEAAAKPKENSAIFRGKLRTKGKMSWLETKTVSMIAKGAKTETKPTDEEYSCSYEVTGNKMKMLLLRVHKPNDRGPGALLGGREAEGIVFFLRRK